MPDLASVITILPYQNQEVEWYNIVTSVFFMLSFFMFFHIILSHLIPCINLYNYHQ